MAQSRFLLKTDFVRFEPIQIAGEPVYQHYARLKEIIGQLAPVASELLAEPVAGGGAVSWYGQGSGEPQPLAALSEARRFEAEALLTRQLTALLPVLDHPEVGPLLRRALVVAEPAAVIALDNTVVLTGWGMGRRGDTSDDAQAAQIRTVLGPYAPFLAGVDAGFLSGSRPVAPRPAVAAPPAQRPTSVPGIAPASLPPPQIHATASVRAPWLPPLLAAVALLFLALGASLVWWHLNRDLAARRMTADVVDGSRTAFAIKLQRETNEQLERDVEQARKALATPNVCVAGNPTGMAPTPELQAVRPENVPPAVPAALGSPPAASPHTLAQLMERATVMVVSAGSEGVAHGTGFFITGDTIVTNAHVVETADPAQIYIMSHAIGRALHAELLNRTRNPAGGNSEPGIPDFAVLHLTEPVSGAQPLALTRKAEKLTDVVAAGYPASVVRVESGMQALREGKFGEPPELVLSRGSISTIQTLPNGLIVMPHSADISPGNSGGPLVDTGGCVVGINTFVSRATEVADRIKYAQKTDNLLTWLTQIGVQPQVRNDSCSTSPPTMPPTPAATR